MWFVAGVTVVVERPILAGDPRGRPAVWHGTLDSSGRELLGEVLKGVVDTSQGEDAGGRPPGAVGNGGRCGMAAAQTGRSRDGAEPSREAAELLRILACRQASSQTAIGGYRQSRLCGAGRETSDRVWGPGLRHARTRDGICLNRDAQETESAKQAVERLASVEQRDRSPLGVKNAGVGINTQRTEDGRGEIFGRDGIVGRIRGIAV